MEPLPTPPPFQKGRGAPDNPPNRFERLHVVLDPPGPDEDPPRPTPTEFYRDASRSVLARNDSPDIPFTYSLNPYRGCEHGCVYCYARPSHEYLGFSAGLDFETRILVKHDAPRLLEEALSRPSWTPQTVALSGNTDPYQPAERRLGLTRQCLEVFLRFRNPVSVISKNRLLVRDVDLLAELAALDLVHVTVSLTTLRPELVSVMEPRTARPALRLRTIAQLAEAGIPVGVNVAPIIPGLTDDEVPALLEAAAAAGARRAHYQIVRLPGPVRELFVAWVRHTFPDRADRIVRRLADLHGPALTDGRFGHRMRGKGRWAEVIESLFALSCRRHGLSREVPRLATHHFRRPPRGGQTELF